MAERLTPAHQAVFRLDAHQQHLEMSPGLAGKKWRWATHAARQGNDGRFYRDDFHDVPSVALRERFRPIMLCRSAFSLDQP